MLLVGPHAFQQVDLSTSIWMAWAGADLVGVACVRRSSVSCRTVAWCSLLVTADGYPPEALMAPVQRLARDAVEPVRWADTVQVPGPNLSPAARAAAGDAIAALSVSLQDEGVAQQKQAG